jgi:hypothetical protein
MAKHHFFAAGLALPGVVTEKRVNLLLQKTLSMEPENAAAAAPLTFNLRRSLD